MSHGEATCNLNSIRSSGWAWWARIHADTKSNTMMNATRSPTPNIKVGASWILLSSFFLFIVWHSICTPWCVRRTRTRRDSEDNREFMNEEMWTEKLCRRRPHRTVVDSVGFFGANKANENRVFLNWHYVECLKFTYYIIHHNTCAPCATFHQRMGERCWDVTIGKIENGAIVPVSD